MVEIIIRKSPRELRERQLELASKAKHFRGMDAYARDIEEADAYQRDVTGRDNPNRKGVVTDDGGKSELELKHRALRAMGITNVEAYD